MNLEEKALLTRIEELTIGEENVEFSFSDRLAKENGWTKEYALQVIEEYKKFLFLCCITKQALTPSDAVDQAWHLHLTYTYSYWVQLCRNTLGRDLHHQPTKGGENEREKFENSYSFALQRYLAVFGKEPPPTIWPDPKVRFSESDFKRVNLRQFRLIPRQTKWRRQVISIIGTLLFIVLVTFLYFKFEQPALLIMLVFPLFSLFKNIHYRRDESHSVGVDLGFGFYYSDSDNGDSGGLDSGCGSGCSGCGGGD